MITRRLRSFLTLAFFVLVASACGSDGGSVDDPTPLAIDPCTLITRAEAEAATGATLSDPAPFTNVDAKSGCGFGSVATVAVALLFYDDASSPEDLLSTAYSPEFVVDDLGDAAVFDAALRELRVVIDNTEFGVSIAGISDAGPAQDAATELARLVVDRL